MANKKAKWFVAVIILIVIICVTLSLIEFNITCDHLETRVQYLLTLQTGTISAVKMAHTNDNPVQQSVCENGRFQNPWPTWFKPSFRNLFRFMFTDEDKSEIPSQEVMFMQCHSFTNPILSFRLLIGIG